MTLNLLYDIEFALYDIKFAFALYDIKFAFVL